MGNKGPELPGIDPVVSTGKLLIERNAVILPNKLPAWNSEAPKFLSSQRGEAPLKPQDIKESTN